MNEGGCTIAACSATAYIGCLGMTGMQGFALGTLIYNFAAVTIAPLIGLQLETMEVETNE